MGKSWVQYGKKAAIAVFWMIIWQLAACLAGNRILLVGPIETLRALGGQAIHGEFWLTVGSSLLRIGAGFTAALALGLLLAAVSGRFVPVEEVLAPVMSLLKAIPVASFVVLFLIWWRSGVLATAVSFCIVLPNIYVNTLEGIRHVDRRLLEMAEVFEIPVWNRFFYIYRPALKPYLDSAIRISVGMSWKSGVAAEVIGIPALSVGEQLYQAKIYLDTAGVLAWTVVTILASVFCERLVLALWGCFQRLEPRCRKPEGGISASGSPAVLELEHVSKSYHGRTVLQDVTACYERGQTYYFCGPSGSGKTTLLRLIAGLEAPDSREDGAISRIERHGSRISMVFQEDRLCEQYSALVNVDMVTGDREKSRAHLCRLLEEEELEKPCGELSGGMKRRVAVARAMAAGGDVILLDEPYTGLDEDSRCRVKQYIHSCGTECALLVATHIGEF